MLAIHAAIYVGDNNAAPIYAQSRPDAVGMDAGDVPFNGIGARE